MSVSLDLNFVREQFPAFSEPSLKGFLHFENAGGSFPCKQCIDALNKFYRTTKVQPYYGFDPSSEAGDLMNTARIRLAAWLNVTSDEIHFSTSTSQNSYVIYNAFREYLSEGDEIVVTNQDHEANIGVWTRLETAGIHVKIWEVNKATAELEIEGLNSVLSKKTKFVAFTHCSNIVGSINPAKEWIKKIHSAGALAIVDGVSYAGHGFPNIGNLDADIYFFSMYKVYGPHLGVMYIKDELNKKLPSQGHFFNSKIPTSRFTPAGPDHAQIAAVNGVIDYFDQVHEHHFEKNIETIKTDNISNLFQDAEKANLKPLLDFLTTKTSVRLIGKNTTLMRAPTVSFVSSKIVPEDLAMELAKEKIGIANGNCYAYRLMNAIGVEPNSGVARISFVHYTNPSEIEKLMLALDKII